MSAPGTEAAPLAMWGGMECTVNRVHELYFDQLALSGHLQRIEEDIARFAALGMRTLRTCLHWERFAAEEAAGTVEAAQAVNHRHRAHVIQKQCRPPSGISLAL